LTNALRDRLAELRRRGYNRLYQQIDNQPGKFVEFSTPESLLSLDFSQPIFVLIDRLALSPDVRYRIVDAIETGYRESGEVQFHTVPREENEPSTHLRYSAAFECSTCHRAYREPEPRLFSFNNPYGAGPRCQGFGNTIDFDPNLILPDRSRTLQQGAIAPWTTPKYRPFHGEMIRFAKSAAIPTDVPWYSLSPAQQELLWEGRGTYPGIRGFFAALERKKYKRLPLQIPRLRPLPRLPRPAPPRRGPRRPDRASKRASPKYLRGQQPHHLRRPGFLRQFATLAVTN
jgi:excinuclease ABC subunit A